MKVQKEIMNLIYVGFSNRQFFIPQDLKFFLVMFLNIFASISQKYVDLYLPKIDMMDSKPGAQRNPLNITKKGFPIPISFFFFFFSFYRLYFSAFTIFNAICKTCSKSLIPHFLQCMHLHLFLFFPPTKNKKTRVVSNFRGDFILFSFN